MTPLRAAVPVAAPETPPAPLHPLLTERWSTRAFDAAHSLSDVEVATLLEAARWAPSASNTQPWRFAVAHRGTAGHVAVLATLVGFNREWAHAASALVVAVAAVEEPDGTPRRWASYDTGQAVAHLTVQAQALGLAVHQMGGFDREALTSLLGLGTDCVPQTVVAVGRHDPAAALPEALAQREHAPRRRLEPAELLLHLGAATA